MSVGTTRPVAPATASGAGANPWSIAVLVSLAAFMEVLDTTIANVALRYIAGGLGVSEDESTWVVTTYLVANAVSLTVSAFLAKTLGRKTFFLICLALFTVSSVLCGFAWNLQSLLLFRIMQGLGGGGLVPVVQAILADLFPPAKRGRICDVRGRRRGGTGGRADIGRLAVRQCLLALVLPDQWPNRGDRDRADRADPARAREGCRGAAEGASTKGRVRPGWLRPGRDISRHARNRARPRARRRLVRLVFHHHGGDRMRARICADDPVGGHPPESDNRRPDGGDAAVRRLLPGDAGHLCHPVLDHPVPARAGAGGFRLHGDVGRPHADTRRRRHDGDDVRHRPSGGQDPAEIPDRRRGGDHRAVAVRANQCLRRSRLLVHGTLADAVWRRAPAGLRLDHHRVLDGIPPDKTGQAAALINAARNTGGSIGISLISNVLWRREQFHQTRLVDQALPSSVQYQDTLHQMTNYFIGQGTSPAEAPMQTIAWVGQQVLTQASLLAYMDAFWVLTLLALAAVPLALSLRKVKLGGAAPAGH